MSFPNNQTTPQNSMVYIGCGSSSTMYQSTVLNTGENNDSIKLTTLNPNKYGAHTPQSNLRAPPQGKCCNPRQPPMSTSNMSCTCSPTIEYQSRATISIEDFYRGFESAPNDTTSNSFTQPTPKDKLYTPMERFILESNDVQPALLAFTRPNGHPYLNITPVLRHE
ncbi:uncharacterized protein LAJ45_05672 [Morchella importuna]|uniref:Uncharacterized protein n=1 Tax=Morchella conica CCBAS932 TaxID=1392247 RepID=A0A3N4KF01_9PEZI|nr:uncharacterized protein LAJ45_05672 [Morchella importuna]KAH8150459.1 hypothetical protein LAJ45_05672 [Morchella importuna]RPB08058.1 hypothetical protein P167DRAFT_578635 [Morchella conica CCBAS932]